jgi:prolyl oligopeptidase
MHSIKVLLATAAVGLALGTPGTAGTANAGAPAAGSPAAGSPAAPIAAATRAGFDYPDTATGSQKDDYHGTVVADPYRWLEGDVRESEAVANWVAAQNAVTFAYLDQLPARDRIEKRLTELWNFERFSVPAKRGEYFFYSHNNGLQNQNIIYRTRELGGEAEVVLDPNSWSEDGTVALGGVELSPSGRYVAYGIQDGGTDWRIWHVKDMATGKVMAEELRWVKFSDIAWAADESGFYYGRYPQPAAGEEFQSLNTDMAVYFHRLGTEQAADKLVHSRPDHPDWGFQAQTTDNGRFVIITTWLGTDDRYRLEYIDLAADPTKVITLQDQFEAGYTLIEAVGSEVYFLTTRDAPRARIVKIDLATGKPRDWQEVVPQQQQVLDEVSLVGGQLVLQYLQDAHSRVAVHDLAGKHLRDVALPGLGTASGFPTAPGEAVTHFSYSSLNQPTAIYRYHVDTGKTEAVLTPKVAFDPDDFTVSQVFYPSRDGTRIPMFIAHRKGVELNGNNPTLLYGYGGFNISLTPQFSVTRLAWMDMGGVFAMANLRGGGEYGEDWHKAGTKLQKQNVFDDFIAAAGYLIDKRYTRTEKLAVQGGSNGGLLIGAVINQRPDLFAAALPAVGVMDMLRFHLFTAGRFWVDDYGSADDPAEFKALYAYSPYHNIVDGTHYPATLVTTADTDDRVVPGHSFKYIARLQEAHDGEDPVLIRIQTRAGHGAGKPTSMIIREYADMWAFLAANLGMKIE